MKPIFIFALALVFGACMVNQVEDGAVISSSYSVTVIDTCDSNYTFKTVMKTHRVVIGDSTVWDYRDSLVKYRNTTFFDTLIVFPEGWEVSAFTGTGRGLVDTIPLNEIKYSKYDDGVYKRLGACKSWP